MFAAGAAALALAACSSDPYFKRTMLAPLTTVEKAMDCRQIDLAIDRADTVRWLIRDAGGYLETSSQRTARYVGNVIIVPVSVLLALAGVLIPPHIPAPPHDELTAADARIRELLQLKRSEGCPPRVTALSGMNEVDVLSKLEPVQADIDAGRGDEDALFAERTRLLDGLRVVPAPAVPAAAAPAKEERPAATKIFP